MTDEKAEPKTAITDSEVNGKGLNSYYSIQLSADPIILAEARRIAADKNVRVEDLSTCVSQDPIVVIELLKIANSLFFGGGKQPVTTVKTALLRLGSDVILDTLDQLRDRPKLQDANVIKWIEFHRLRSRKCSILARMIAEILSKNLADDCQTSGLLSYLGEMIAVANFEGIYTKLAEEHPRSIVLYRLVQDHKFDVESVCIEYLARAGIPHLVYFPIERNGTTKIPERAILKPLINAACEMLDHFDNNKWDKIAPGRKLPPKSPLRMIQLTEPQYLKLYDKATQYLITINSLDEKNQDSDDIEINKLKPEIDINANLKPSVETPSTFDDEISKLINQSNVEFDPEEANKEKIRLEKRKEEIDAFKLNGPRVSNRVRKKLGNESAVKINQLPSASVNTQQTVTKIFENINSFTSSEELISSILKALVDNGPFEKTALMVVSSDRKDAIVVASRGQDATKGQKLSLADPLSPLSNAISKIQSFGKEESANSPFGSKTFAISPIDADHETPVILYADCGNLGSITFEARRIFRSVVEILNKTLPTLPGGIPVEVEIK